MEINYKARVWRTKILLKEVEEQFDVMIEGLLPETYRLKISEGDWEVPGFPHAPHYKCSAELISDQDSPHWFVHAYTKAEAKAKILGLMFDWKPVFPLT